MKFNPALEYGAEFDESLELRTYFTATAVRVVLVEPTYRQPLLSYYAIAQLSIEGQCQCFGHASACTGQVTCKKVKKGKAVYSC